jgi:hypothetical protein
MCIRNSSHSLADNWVCALRCFLNIRHREDAAVVISGVVCLHARLVGIASSLRVARSGQITRKCVTPINLLKKISSVVLSTVKRNVAVARPNSALNGVLLILSDNRTYSARAG